MASCSLSPPPNLSLSLSYTQTQHSVILLSFLTMRAMSCCFLVLFLQILSLVGASGRHLDLEDGFALYNQGTLQNPNSLQETHISTEDMKKRMELMEGPGAKKEINKIGSSPPSCERKCYGCMPCEAIQVPANSGRAGLQYTNYEPEGWRCKCGPAFYSP